MEDGYTNREDHEKDGRACTLDPMCQLVDDHSDGCDHRREQERWEALYAILDKVDTRLTT